MKSIEEILEEANNVSIENIIENYTLLIECIRKYFSRVCSDHNATENNQYELDIDIEGTMGLAEHEKIKYLTVWEQVPEGIIYFKVGDIYERFSEIKEFDDLEVSELIYIIKELNSYV